MFWGLACEVQMLKVGSAWCGVRSLDSSRRSSGLELPPDCGSLCWGGVCGELVSNPSYLWAFSQYPDAWRAFVRCVCGRRWISVLLGPHLELEPSASHKEVEQKDCLEIYSPACKIASCHVYPHMIVHLG